MAKHIAPEWWGKPKNFDERVKERKVSWLELFYDLVYVAAIGQFTFYLSEHASWQAAGISFLVFSFVFWSWVNGSQYYDLHGSDGLRTRLMTFWQMLSLAAAAITIPSALDGSNHKLFAITFSLVQLYITYMWWSVGIYDPSHRVFNRFYTVHYLIALALLIISIFTPVQTTYILWGVALLFNLTPSLTVAPTIKRELNTRGQVFTASAAIVERFGLFTIIVLAESILATVTGVAAVPDKQAMVWVAFIMAILFSFLLWWIYFDMMSTQETKTGYNYMQWLIFLHFPLLASLAFIGACLKILLSNVGNALNPVVVQMFCTSLAVILLMIVGLAKIMEGEEEDLIYINPVSRVLLLEVALLFMLPGLLSNPTTLSLLGCATVLLLIPVFVGVRSWIRFKFF